MTARDHALNEAGNKSAADGYPGNKRHQFGVRSRGETLWGSKGGDALVLGNWEGRSGGRWSLAGGGIHRRVVGSGPTHRERKVQYNPRQRVKNRIQDQRGKDQGERITWLKHPPPNERGGGGEKSRATQAKITAIGSGGKKKVESSKGEGKSLIRKLQRPRGERFDGRFCRAVPKTRNVGRKKRGSRFRASGRGKYWLRG